LWLVRYGLGTLFDWTIRKRIVLSGSCTSTIGSWSSCGQVGLDVLDRVRVTLPENRRVTRLGTATD
jgi:hypothetical protein